MTLPAVRLALLHLRSRHAPLALILLAVSAGTLRAVSPWTVGTGQFAQLLPPVLAVAAAAIISTTTRSPFGEPERATNPLPMLRLMHVLTLLPIAAGSLALARLGHHPLSTVRDLAGFTGLALITTVPVGAALSWITPLGYVLYCGGPLDIGKVNLWSWPVLPADNRPATVIALLLLLAGLITTTAAGAPDQRTDPD